MSKQPSLKVYLNNKLIETYPKPNWALCVTKRKELIATGRYNNCTFKINNL